jgi:hypothetical protein
MRLRSKTPWRCDVRFRKGAGRDHDAPPSAEKSHDAGPCAPKKSGAADALLLPGRASPKKCSGTIGSSAAAAASAGDVTETSAGGE